MMRDQKENVEQKRPVTVRAAQYDLWVLFRDRVQADAEAAARVAGVEAAPCVDAVGDGAPGGK